MKIEQLSAISFPILTKHIKPSQHTCHRILLPVIKIDFAFAGCVNLFRLGVLTFKLSVLTFKLGVLTFRLGVLTFKLCVLTF